MSSTIRVINDGPGDVVIQRTGKDGTPTQELPYLLSAAKISDQFDVSAGISLRVIDQINHKE